jgi:hypothetical protein
VQAKRTCWGLEIQLLSLLNSALDGSEWSGLLSGPFKTGERPVGNVVYVYVCILTVVYVFLDAATLTEGFSVLFPRL